MAADDDFRHESVQDRQSIVRYLQAVTAGIEAGRIEIGTGDTTFELQPGGMIELELRAKRKGDRVKFSIKLHWREDGDVDDGDALEIKVGPRS